MEMKTTKACFFILLLSFFFVDFYFVYVLGCYIAMVWVSGMPHRSISTCAYTNQHQMKRIIVNE